MVNRKIAILTPTFNYYSGIDRVAQQQAEEYSRKGNKVTVIALEADIVSNNYSLVNLGMPENLFLQRLYRLFFFLDFKKIKHCVEKLKNYDVVISHFYPMNWLAYFAKKKFGTKYIYWDHGINTMGFLGNILQKLYMEIFLFFNNITLKNVDEAFSVSKYLSNQLYKESGIRSRVVYNKIDKKRFNNKINGKDIIKKYNLENKKILLYVGRIAPHKGIHLLLKIFFMIKKSIPNSKLLIAGKPTFNNYFKKQKNFSKKEFFEDIIFTGFVDDKNLPQYYAACDVYVTCSQWEGFNLPVAEAQACNKPVVAFNIGPHPEIVRKGVLVKNKDVKGFANAVIKILLH